jgi:hypothetical protein
MAILERRGYPDTCGRELILYTRNIWVTRRERAPYKYAKY